MENLESNKILYIGEHKSGKTKQLSNYWLENVNNSSCNSNDLAVFVRTKTHEAIFRDVILNHIKIPVGQINIYRFRAFVNQTISKYWFHLFKNPPKYIGFSQSIFMLREFLSKNTLLLQNLISTELQVSNKSNNQFKFNRGIILGIFERQQRLAENGLELIQLKDIDNQETNLLAGQLNKIIFEYTQWLINRDIPYLDYALQLNFFLKLINNSDILDNIANDFNHCILIDDIDDSFYVEHYFYESLWNKIPNIIYTGNKYGSIRENFGSDIYYLDKLKNECNEVNQLTINSSEIYNLGQFIYNNITDSNHFLTNYNDDKFNNFEYIQAFQYGDMLEEIKKLPLKFKTLGYNAHDIVFINQSSNEQLQLELQKSLEQIGWKLDVLRVSEELLKKPLINTIMTILRIVYYNEIKEKSDIQALTSFDFSQLINTVGNTDAYQLAKLRKGLKNNPENWLSFFKEYSQKGFITVKNIYEIIQDCLKIKNQEDNIYKYNKMINFIWQNLIEKNELLRKYNIKNDFRIFTDMLNKHLELSYENNIEYPILNFIYSVISGEISDNPDRDIILNNDCAKMMTSQKSAELKMDFKIQIWIDITSDAWNRKVISPYVNPYVLLKSRDFNEQWSSYEEIKLSEEKFAKNLRLNLSLCTEKAYFFSCDYNSMGESNNNDLLKNILEIAKK